MSLADRVKAAKEADAQSDNQREETRKDLRRKLHFKVVEGLGPTLVRPPDERRRVEAQGHGDARMGT